MIFNLLIFFSLFFSSDMQNESFEHPSNDTRVGECKTQISALEIYVSKIDSVGLTKFKDEYLLCIDLANKSFTDSKNIDGIAIQINKIYNFHRTLSQALVEFSRVNNPKHSRIPVGGQIPFFTYKKNLEKINIRSQNIIDFDRIPISIEIIIINGKKELVFFLGGNPVQSENKLIVLDTIESINKIINLTNPSYLNNFLNN